MALTYEPIATTTLGSTATNITFSGITSAYTDLIVIFIATTSTSDGLAMQLNGITTTTYSNAAMGGTGGGGTVASTATINQSYFYLDLYGSASTTIPTMRKIHIFSYTNASNKSVLIETSADKNGGGTIERSVGLWRNTAAITSIKLYSQNGYNLNAGTIATLYGIKAA